MIRFTACGLGLLAACAQPAGWIDGVPFADLERAVARAAPGAVVDIADGEHDVGLVVTVPLTLRGRGDAVLTGDGARRVVTAEAHLTLEDLVVTDGFASEGAGVLALDGLTLRRVHVLNGRGAELVSVRGDLDATDVVLDTPWPAIRLRAAQGRVALERVTIGPGAESAAILTGPSATLTDVALGDTYWGSVVRVDGDARVAGLSFGSAVQIRGARVVATDVSGEGALELSGDAVTLEDARARLIIAEARDQARVRRVVAEALGAAPADVEGARLSGPAPKLALGGGTARAVVMASEAHPVSLSLADASIDGLLVLDAAPYGAPGPGIEITGAATLRHLTWVGGRRDGLTSGGPLALDQSVLAHVALGRAPEQVTAADTWGWDLGLEGAHVPWTYADPHLRGIDDPRLADDSPLLGQGADGHPGAFGGAHGDTIRALWEAWRAE